MAVSYSLLLTLLIGLLIGLLLRLNVSRCMSVLACVCELVSGRESALRPGVGARETRECAPRGKT